MPKADVVIILQAIKYRILRMKLGLEKQEIRVPRTINSVMQVLDESPQRRNSCVSKAATAKPEAGTEPEAPYRPKGQLQVSSNKSRD